VIGRPTVVDKRLERFGLRMRAGVDFTLVNPEFDPRYRDYWETYHRLAARRGISEQYAKIEMRRRLTLIGAMMIHKGDADGMICGTFGTHRLHLPYIDQVIGRRADAKVYAAMNILMVPGRQLALVDTHVNINPSAEEIAEITILAAEQLTRMGIEPRVALVSHSNFGTSDAPSAIKMREALALIRARAPGLDVDGEMHADAAVDTAIRGTQMPYSTLAGDANLLVCPDIDSANISYNLLKATAGHNVAIGPLLLGAAKPVNILTSSATVRRIVNMTALTVLEANSVRQPELL
jgi:malate dehydrogenase (oxaloacetate-decarboxylating)(NADP+)